MTIYLLLHLAAAISLLGCLTALACMTAYFARARRNPPAADAHRIASANLRRTLAACARHCCIAALADMLSCAALWLLAAPQAEAEALHQLFLFANGALLGGAVGGAANVIAAYVMRTEAEQRWLLRPSRLLNAALWLLGMTSLAAVAYLTC